MDEAKMINTENPFYYYNTLEGYMLSNILNSNLWFFTMNNFYYKVADDQFLFVIDSAINSLLDKYEVLKVQSSILPPKHKW